MNEPMIDAKQVAEMLGVSIHTVYRLKDKTGGLPAYKVGGCVRFRRSEVETYITTQTVKPAEKPEPFAKDRFQYKPGMKVVSL